MGREGIRRPLGYAEPSLKRLHRRIFRLNDKIEAIEREEKLVMAELEYHRSIDDDAQRDAAVGNYIDREEALFDGLFGRAAELHEDPLHAFLIGLKLFAEMMGDLDKQGPEPPRCGLDEDGLPSLEPTEGNESMVGGQVLAGDGGPFVETERRRDLQK